MTASELAQHALAANYLIRSAGSQFTFNCPEDTPCSSCGMWEISAKSKCLFWDRDVVPISLQFEAITILKSTHPELFV